MRRRLGAAVLAVALVTAGCSGLPESGPVVDVNVASVGDDERPNDFVPAPPADGASATEIVRGFLDAMTASPISAEVARQFLAASAAAEWDPEAATITYAGPVETRDEGLRVTAVLPYAERIDRTGAWQGRLSPAEEELAFDLTFQDGQYRITDPPDALIVPASWFTQRFRPASLYFFDPSARILVPQPVFVPRGDQLASALISGLLAGPGERLRGVVRSFLPLGLSVQVSVPVSVDGVAEITLLGEPGVQTPAAVDKMLAQLAWTLRQEPAIRALRVTVGDEVVRTPDGDDEYVVDEADAYDPNGVESSDDLFAVRDGVLSVRDGNELVPVGGPFGTGTQDVGRAAVNLDATAAAAVSSDGRRLLVADLGGGAEPGAPVRVRLRGSDLLRPAWDFADRIWVVDRTARGAVVRYVADGRAQPIRVQGVTGRDVRRLLVSRDGTRLVAVVRGTSGDELRVGRIEVDDRGALDRVSSTQAIVVQPGAPVRIRDVAWTSPTTLALLSPVVQGELFEVRTVSVDGSPTSAEALSRPVGEPVTALVGSPEPGLATYAVTSDSLLDLTGEGTYGFVGGPATSFGYVG